MSVKHFMNVAAFAAVTGVVVAMRRRR